jgi:hypothetical protein
MPKTPRYEIPEGVPIPDAILLDRDVYPGGDFERSQSHKAAFGHLLAPKGQDIYASDYGRDRKIFLRVDLSVGVLWPEDHPTDPKGQRFDWVEASPGVQFGYQRKDPTPAAPKGATDEVRARLLEAGLIRGEKPPEPEPEPEAADAPKAARRSGPPVNPPRP